MIEGLRERKDADLKTAYVVEKGFEFLICKFVRDLDIAIFSKKIENMAMSNPPQTHQSKFKFDFRKVFAPSECRGSKNVKNWF